MKTRKDQLIEFAFGELTDAEKKSLNPSAAERRDLDDLRCLRADLKRLQEVPECQMSVERMRDAVLKSEIRQRRDWRRWLPLGAAPLAAGLVLIALAVIKTPEASAPSLTANHGSGSVVADLVQPTHSALEDSASVEAIMNSTSAFVNNFAPNPEVADHVAIRSSARSARVASVRLASRVKSSPTPPKVDKHVEPISTVPTPTSQPEPIVMISSEEDSNTGARRANEVETSHDVVIGG